MRTPLKPGTLLRLHGSQCYEITGAPLGEGGGSLIYPAVRCLEKDGVFRREALEYALKECYPVAASAAVRFERRENGEIAAAQGDANAAGYLQRVKKMQLAEQQVTDRIYRTGFRLTPILSAAEDAELSFDGGTHFNPVHNTIIVMESLSGKGRALKGYLTRPHRITLAQAMRITEQVLMALREVHRAGCLHLDIQDGNVFIKGALEEGSDFASLIDFGSARGLLEDGRCAPITDRVLFSTPGFRAPEMLHHNDGSLRLGPEADLYSVGYLLLLLLTGQRRNPHELYAWKDRRRILTRMNLNRLHCPRHLVEQLQEIVGRALENEPEHRYHSAEEMLKEVESFASALRPHQSELLGTRFDAFLCYRHGIPDSPAAKGLQRALERFHAPRLNTGDRQRRRFRRVFLDESELASSANYEEEIRTALNNSGWLIVLCSPGTPDSERVRKEIDWFLETHDRSRILAVLTAGEPEDAFPPQLLGSGKQGEVLAADARGKDLSETLRRIQRECVLRLAAPMLGTTYDTLKQRHRSSMLRRRACICALAAVLCVVILTLFGLQRQERQLKLAEYAQNALAEGDPGAAIRCALEGSAGPLPLEAPLQRVLTDALGVYDLSDGFRPAGRVSLSGEPLFLALSPSGTTAAAVTTGTLTLFDADSGRSLAALPVTDSALAQAAFAGEQTLLYAGTQGLVCYDLAAQSLRWTGDLATSIAVSGDGRRAACLYRDQDYAVVYDTATGAVLGRISFQGRKQSVLQNDRYASLGENLLTLNEDGSMLAVSFGDGSLALYDVDDPESVTILLDSSDETRGFEGGFFGQFFAFSFTGGGQSAFCVVDTDTMQQTGGFQGDASYSVQAGENGIFLQSGNLVVQIDPVTGEQTPLVQAEESILRFIRRDGRTLTTFRDGFRLYDQRGSLIFSQRCEEGCDWAAFAGNTILCGSLSSVNLRLCRAQDHPEAQIVCYDHAYEHSEARISADGETVMLFSIDGFQILNRQGRILKQTTLPDSDKIYDQQFVREGSDSWLEVTWYDGTVVSYRAEDGSVSAQRSIPPPSLDIEDHFLTDRYEIRSPLHGTPQVYDRKTGKLCAELEEDAYLTYVTQVKGGIVTQYITAEGTFYGQLLNDNLEVVAQLPALCDVWDETLYFDYPDGSIRAARIYPQKELIALGNKQRGGI